MKTFILALMLTVTAMSGVVAAAQPAAAGGCCNGIRGR